MVIIWGHGVASVGVPSQGEGGRPCLFLTERSWVNLQGTFSVSALHAQLGWGAWKLVTNLRWEANKYVKLSVLQAFRAKRNSLEKWMRFGRTQGRWQRNGFPEANIKRNWLAYYNWWKGQLAPEGHTGDIRLDRLPGARCRMALDSGREIHIWNDGI